MRKNMKKVLGLTLCLACTVCMMGCSDGGTAKESVTMKKMPASTENSVEKQREESVETKTEVTVQKGYDLNENVFLCPVVYDDDPTDERGWPVPLAEPDYDLHFLPGATEMWAQGCSYASTIVIPDEYSPNEEIDESRMLHIYLVYNNATGLQFVPLFTSYEALVAIFGTNVRVGVVSVYDAKELSKEDTKVAGIVVDPGVRNETITREEMMQFPDSYLSGKAE